MTRLLSAAKKAIAKLRNLFPSPLPVGMAEFETWSLSIVETYDFPNNDSIRFALATMIMHSGPTAAYVSKHHFSLAVKASMAKQIAGGAFHDMKQRQMLAQQAAAQKAEEEKIAAVTASQEAAGNVQPVQN